MSFHWSKPIRLPLAGRALGWYGRWRITPLGVYVRGQVNAALAGVAAFAVFQLASWALALTYASPQAARDGPAAFLFEALAWIKVVAALSGFAIYSGSEILALLRAIRTNELPERPLPGDADTNQGSGARHVP